MCAPMSTIAISEYANFNHL